MSNTDGMTAGSETSRHLSDVREEACIVTLAH